MNSKFKKYIEKATEKLKYKSLDDALMSLTKWAEDEQISDYNRLLDLCSYYRYSFLNISFIKAVKNNKPHLFNDALFLYNRINVKHEIKIPDGSGGLSNFTDVLEAFAGNDIAMVNQLYPNDKPAFIGKQMAFPQAVSNLLLGMVQHNDSTISQGKDDAKRCLNNKNAHYEVAMIHYLLALVNKDVEQIATAYNHLIKNYRRARWLHDFKNPLSKVIALNIYGLHNLARYYLSPSDFSQVKFSTNNDLIWDEFSKISTSGKPAIIFTKRLAPLNKIYE